MKENNLNNELNSKLAKDNFNRYCNFMLQMIKKYGTAVYENTKDK